MYRISQLEGQVAVITGAAQGLGESLAIRLDYECCKVVVADINIDAAQKVASRLQNAVAVQVDAMIQITIENMRNWTSWFPTQRFLS